MTKQSQNKPSTGSTKTKKPDDLLDPVDPDLLPDLPDEVEPILQKLPKEEQRVLLSVFKQQFYSGPLPPPSVLKGFEQVLPGSAERIFTSFEKQAEHRQAIEKKVIDKQLVQTSRGQNYALFISILLIAAGLVLTLKGYPQVGIVIFSATVVGLATVFIVGRRNKKREED